MAERTGEYTLATGHMSRHMSSVVQAQQGPSTAQSGAQRQADTGGQWRQGVRQELPDARAAVPRAGHRILCAMGAPLGLYCGGWRFWAARSAK